MYFVVKHSYSDDSRELLLQTEDPVIAFLEGTKFDAQCKVGLDENETGNPSSFVTIEDDQGKDCWQECVSFACPPVGLFN